MKYSLAIIYMVPLAILMVLLPIINAEDASYTFLPGTTDGIQLFVLFLAAILVSIIVGTVLGYISAPVYLYLYKVINRRAMIYGIEERPQSDEFRTKFRGFFPGLMAINIGLVMAPFLMDIVLNSDILLTRSAASNLFMTVVGLLMFTLGPSVGLFAGAWFLKDTGIVCCNNEKVKDTEELIEVKSVGGWFLRIFEGYAGIGVLFSYAVIMINFLGILGLELVDYLSIVLAVLAPVLIVMGLIPTQIILDMLKKHRKRYILKMAESMGIKEIVKLDFNNFI